MPFFRVEYSHDERTFLALILAGAACLAPTTSALAKPPVLTEADKGKEIKVKLGQTFTLKLPSNPTTGYSWFLLTGPSPWASVSRKYAQSPARPGMVGVGGTETFTFKATSVGAGYLRLFYARPFEEKLDPESAWQVRIDVAK